MMNKWFTIVFLFHFIHSGMGKTISEILFTKSLKIDQFLGRCPGYNRLPLYLQDIHYATMKDHTITMSAKIIATRNFLPKLKLVLKLDRCKAREDLDSCEPYQDVIRNNVCDLQKIKNQPWSALFSQMRPELPCPLTKGTYVSENSTFDTIPLMALPIQGWYWKISALLYEAVPSNLIMCIFASGTVQ